MAGLATARVLADHFEPVTVVDRDPLPERHRSPQGRAPGPSRPRPAGRRRPGHRALFPGIMDELVADGAALIEFNGGSWYQAGGYRAESLIERQVVSAPAAVPRGPTSAAGRGAPERHHRVRPRRRDLLPRGGRVTRRQGVRRTASRDLAGRPRGRLLGSRLARRALDGGRSATRRPRSSRCAATCATPPWSLPPAPGDLDGTFAVTIESPPHGKRAAFLLPDRGRPVDRHDRGRLRGDGPDRRGQLPRRRRQPAVARDAPGARGAPTRSAPWPPTGWCRASAAATSGCATCRPGSSPWATPSAASTRSTARA